MALSEEARARLAPQAAEIIGRYPRPRSALLPLLHLVQSEEGYVSQDGIEFCAGQLGLTEADVTGVVSFYTMYKRKPVGEYHVGVCTTALCAVMGGDAILADLTEHLGVAVDEPTGDGKVSVEHVECNAACDYAPVRPRSGGRPAHRRRGQAHQGRAAAVHLEAGVEDPGRLHRRPGR
jgi:NADH-quinone oxidoreductase subunit E